MTLVVDPIDIKDGSSCILGLDCLLGLVCPLGSVYSLGPGCLLGLVYPLGSVCPLSSDFLVNPCIQTLSIKHSHVGWDCDKFVTFGCTLRFIFYFEYYFGASAEKKPKSAAYFQNIFLKESFIDIFEMIFEPRLWLGIWEKHFISPSQFFFFP